MRAPQLSEDWHKAALFVYLVEVGLPSWASGENEWKALGALTGWPEKKCLAALEEAKRMGMIIRKSQDSGSFAA